MKKTADYFGLAKSLELLALVNCHHPDLQVNDEGMCCDCGACVACGIIGPHAPHFARAYRAALSAAKEPQP